MANYIHTVKEFAGMIYQILKTDRGVNIAVAGETGEGKSTFLTLLQQEYAKISGTNWSFDESLTWDRDELRVWIDGKGEEKKGQKPEYSAIMADEMINMFFSQEWHDPEQMDMIKVLNQCRDRHLFFGGNNPGFFDLNPKVRERFNFFAFIPERGTAWILVPEKNPFTKDKWNAQDNIKIYRKFKRIDKSPNFAFIVKFGDLDDDSKKKYLAIRNKKRVESLDKTQEKRDIKNNGKKDYMIGSAMVALVNITGESVKAISKKYVGVHHITGMKYYNLGVSHQKSKEQF